MKKNSNTSWNKVADWYNKSLGEDSYHQTIIIPGILELLKHYLKSSEKNILDLACGQGIVSKKLFDEGYTVTGIDLAPELIRMAQKNFPQISFEVQDARNLSQSFMKNKSGFDTVICNLALQNMDNLQSVFKEVARVLKPKAKFIFVINHPSFRIPRLTSWGWDEQKKMQYRRVDRYLTEQKIPIIMHPGKANSEETWSFHRPMQTYAGLLRDSGLSLIDIREWISDKSSQPGPKAKAENTARQEFPLFMAIVAEKK